MFLNSSFSNARRDLYGFGPIQTIFWVFCVLFDRFGSAGDSVGAIAKMLEAAENIENAD